MKQFLKSLNLVVREVLSIIFLWGVEYVGNMLNTEVQIKEIMDRLRIISIEISNMNKVNTAMESYDITQITRVGKQCPIKDHPLRETDEYTKKLYLTVLSSIMQYNSIGIEDKLLFFARIKFGCEAEINLADVIKKGIEVNDELYDEFIRVIKERELQYNFIVDALILSGCTSELEKETTEYIAEIASVLSINAADIKILCEIASIILTQNEKEFLKTFDVINSKLHHFICYTKDFVNGILVSNQELFCFRSQNTKKIEIDFVFSNKKVEIINAEIVLLNKNLIFKENQIAHIKKCNFILKSEKANDYFDFLKYQDKFIDFENCTNILMNECNFSMVGTEIATGHLIHIGVCNNIVIENCRFTDILIGGSTADSTFIYCENLKNLRINNVHAMNCTIQCGNREDLIGGIIFTSNIEKSVVESCKFLNVNLKRYDGNGYIVNGEYQGIIKGVDKINDCQVINSGNLIAKLKVGRSGLFESMF